MDVDAFIDAANKSIVRTAEATSASETAWDGFGGLVLIGESVVFKEEGLFTAFTPFAPNSTRDSQRPKSSTSASTSGTQSPIVTSNDEEKSHIHFPRPVDHPELPSTEVPKPVLCPRTSTPGSFKEKSPGTPEDLCDQSRRNVETKEPSRLPTFMIKNNPLQEKNPRHPFRQVLDHSASDVERFKSRLMAVRSEGLPAKETLVKCAGIADDAFRLAVTKLQSNEFADAFLLAEVAEMACPTTITTARTKILNLKKSALKRLRKATLTSTS